MSMEDNRSTVTNRQGKRKIHPRSSLSIIGGEGGIAGLFVFGGALAIAGFMAVASFASNKHKTKGTHDHQSKPKPKPKPKPQQLLLEEHGCKNNEDQGTTQSLTSLIQHSAIQHGDATCCWTSNMSINQVSDSSDLLSAQYLILGKSELKPRKVEESPTQFHHQEIVFSNSSHPGSAASSNESGVAEECMIMGGQARELEKEEEVEDDDLTSSEYDDDMLSDDVSEIGEQDSSKATWNTSLDYNEEPVWQAELIQRQHAKQKFMGDGYVCCDSDFDDSEYDRATLNQNLNFFMVPNNQPLTWVFPLLLLALLLLLVLLTHRPQPQESFYVLDEGNSVVQRI